MAVTPTQVSDAFAAVALKTSVAAANTELGVQLAPLFNAGGGGSGGAVDQIIASLPLTVAPVSGVGIVTVGHAVSGVTAATYGDATHFPVVVLDVYGHVTGISVNALPSMPGPATVAPLALGVAAVGTSLLYARQDHVHPIPTATEVGAEPAITAGTSSQVYLGPKAWGQVADAQVASGAAVAWSKISKSGAVAADVGAQADMSGYIPVTGDGEITVASGGRLEGLYQVRWEGANRVEQLMVTVSTNSYGDATLNVLDYHCYGAGSSFSAVTVRASTDNTVRYLTVTIGNRNGSLGGLATTYLGVDNPGWGGDYGTATVLRTIALVSGQTHFGSALAADGAITFSGIAGGTGGIVRATSTGALGMAVAADFPTLNQSTTGSAATLATPRTLTIGSTGKSFNGSADVGWSLAEIGAAPATGGSYLPLAGGTIDPGGMIHFNQSVGSYGAAGGIWGQVGDNDWWGIRGGSTGPNAGYLEIATGDDGTSAAEPIYVRQYLGGFDGTITRTLTLLDGSGNTGIPGTMGVYGLLTANAGISATHVGTTTLSASGAVTLPGIAGGTGGIVRSTSTGVLGIAVAADFPTLPYLGSSATAVNSSALGGVGLDYFVQGNGGGAKGHRTTAMGLFDVDLPSGFYDSNIGTDGPQGAVWTHLIHSHHNGGDLWSFDIAAPFAGGSGGSEAYYMRINTGASTYGTWRQLWHDGNLSASTLPGGPYLPLTGGTLTGNISLLTGQSLQGVARSSDGARWMHYFPSSSTVLSGVSNGTSTALINRYPDAGFSGFIEAPSVFYGMTQDHEYGVGGQLSLIASYSTGRISFFAGSPTLQANGYYQAPKVGEFTTTGLSVFGSVSASSAAFSGLLTANAGISATHVGTSTLSVGSSTGFVRSAAGVYSASALTSGDVTGALGYTPVSGGPYLPLAGGTLTGLLTANAGISVNYVGTGALEASGTITFSSIGQGVPGFVRSSASGIISSSALSSGDIPTLDASKVTTGTFADARIASAANWNGKLNAASGVGTGEFHFGNSSYNDPDPGNTRDAKFGQFGIAASTLKTSGNIISLGNVSAAGALNAPVVNISDLAASTTRMATVSATGQIGATTWANDGPWLPLTGQKIVTGFINMYADLYINSGYMINGPYWYTVDDGFYSTGGTFTFGGNFAFNNSVNIQGAANLDATLSFTTAGSEASNAIPSGYSRVTVTSGGTTELPTPSAGAILIVQRGSAPVSFYVKPANGHTLSYTDLGGTARIMTNSATDGITLGAFGGSLMFIGQSWISWGLVGAWPQGF